jgi:ankyrin repeat protein
MEKIMYKIFIRTLLFITLPVLTILAMEEDKEQADIDGDELAEILDIEPTNLFYKALPIVKKYYKEEIENLKEIENNPELKNYALTLKKRMDNYLFLNIDIAEIEALLDFGADVNYRGEEGATPLISIAKDIRKPRLIKIAKLLIKHDADINAVDRYNGSALLYAALYLNPDMVQLLLKYRAIPNIEDLSSKTPLMYAANQKTTDENKQRQLNTINLLIEYGAKLFKRNPQGQTAYDIALAKGNTEVANVLKKAMRKRGEEIFKPQGTSKNV